LARREAPPDAFGRTAREYEVGRPLWPEELVDRVIAELRLRKDSAVLDLGAGTGKLTRALVPRFAHVTAVEPDGEMLAVLHEVVPDAKALRGSAEAIPLEDASVDAVFVGEAFHWFAAADAITEIARVLQPRGGLAIFWTHWWETEPPLPEPALELLREPYERFADQRNPPWDERFEGSPFEPLQYERLTESIVVEPDALLEMYSTTSSLAAISQEEREALFARVRPLLTSPYRLPLKHELTRTRLA
jgi:ubiquinone/menaquinone biosynthesis C-methylase UbiE